ncbi:MAG: hypothetical protein IT562_12595 [Alphaproteobacteria bacterium]|nr:hypothetical protein [Alphaproteobacteria bacterium]
MSREFFALSFGFAVLIAATQMAEAQANCGTHDELTRQLQDRYGESRQTIGLADNNAVVELFASAESGTWTILVTTPGGPTCMVAAGGAFQLLAEEPPKPGRGA